MRPNEDQRTADGPNRVSGPPSAPRRLLTRRRVLRGLAGGTLAGAAGAFGWAMGFEPHWLEVVERTALLAGLPPSLAGKRLVQVSDLHVGRSDVDYLVRVMSRVNALRPDLIALTGDVIDHQGEPVLRDVSRVLGALHPAALASVACLGNHDFGYNWSDARLGDRVAGVANDAGLRVLRNERVDVAGLTIAGMDDLWSPSFRPREALGGLDASRDAVCLCHNPDACDAAEAWHGFRGLILSGHTHGGQCKPPWLPPPLLPVANRRYVAGFYEVGERRRVYVNRGVGHTLRARFNCRPEVTVVTLAPG